MGQIISIQTFILGILGNVNRKFKRNDEASIRQEVESNLKSLSSDHMDLANIYVEQKRKIMIHAIMMEELDNDLIKTHDSIKDIEDACENCTKVDIAFKSVENTLSAGLFDIRLSQADIIGRIEGYQLLSSIHQEELRYKEAVKLVASLKLIFNDFSNQTRAINNLALNKRISKLELKDGIFEYLKGCILTQSGSMYSFLADLIYRQFTIPQHKDDKLSLGMLELLCTGVDVYLYMLAFLLQQYTILCHTYYHKNDLDKYNEYYFRGANDFDHFSSTLLELSDKIVNVLVTIQNLQFIQIYRKDVTEFIAKKLDKLKSIKPFLSDNYKKLVKVNRPERLKPNLDYTSSKIETPILEWTSGSVLFYAVHFLSNSTEPFSVTSFWSNGDTIDRLANPSVSIYRDPLERTRVIFRHIANGQTQIVAVVNNAEQIVFRDIDRDLYNAVNRLDEKEALKYVKIYLENGANASAVFENNRRAIHAAAQNNQWAVAEELLKTDANLVNAIDGNGHTPIYIATEAGHESFVQNLLNIKGIDVNVPTNKKNHQLTALHCALYKGHTEIVKKLMQISSIDVNVKTTDGFTALHFATYFNQTEIISLLSNVTQTDFNALSGQIEIPLSLSLNGAANDKHIESFVKSGHVSPLQIASAFATKSAVDNMLKNSKMQTIHSKTNDASNVLHFAAFNQDVNILSGFEAHMNVNQTVDTQNQREFTPIYNACYRDNDLVQEKLVLGHCANVNIRLSNRKTLLHLAAMHGHVYAATRLSCGISVSTTDWFDRTPLHYAVWLGDIEMVRTLINQGANLNAVDRYANPAIHLVINLTEDKALAIIRIFVDSDKNVDLNFRGAHYNTLLHYMCALEYLSVVKYLLGRPNMAINTRNDQSVTILYVAAFVGNLDLFKMVIEAYSKNDINDPCEDLMGFALKGKCTLEIIEYLLHKYPGPKPWIKQEDLISAIETHRNDIFYRFEYLKWVSEDGMRGLFLTSLEFANCDVALYCFRDEEFRETFPNSIIELDKHWTALYYTLVHGGDSKMVQCILENAPDYIATLEVDDLVDGKTLLHLAIEKGHIEATELLLGMGAPFDSADFNGTTQLHLAAKNGLDEIVKRLIEKGAVGSINKKNKDGQTPLYLATAGYGNLELVMYLLALAANLDGDKANNTLVNAAACANKTDLVEHFISLGVDCVHANEDGVTPLHNAARNNNLDLVNYFLDQDKVDVNAKTRDNRTALYYAVQYDGDIDVVNSLLDKYATVDPDDRSAKIDNLLVVAIAHNKIDIAKTLLLADIDIEWGGDSSISGIYQAIISDNVEMAKILLERGASPATMPEKNIFESPLKFRFVPLIQYGLKFPKHPITALYMFL